MKRLLVLAVLTGCAPGAALPVLSVRASVQARAKRLAAVTTDRPVQLRFGLPLHERAGLDDLLQAQYEAAGAAQGVFLTPEQFAARFYPTPDEVAALSEALVRRGFTVHGQIGATLAASAQVATIKAVLGTELSLYATDDGDTFVAAVNEPTLPADLPVRYVTGLSTAARLQPHSLQPRAIAATQIEQPAALRNVYDVPASRLGDGQRLAIVTLGDYARSDIDAFVAANNLPAPNITDVLVGSRPAVSEESVLDIDMALSMAPRLAELRVIQGTNSGVGLQDAINRLANPVAGEALARVASLSWGASEDRSSDAELGALADLFAQMAAQGQSIFVASGDNGAWDNGSTLSVDFPASAPYAVAVGGTTLYRNSGQYAGEAAWSGGGGGASAKFAIPSWQRGTPGLVSTSMRNLPDVAMNADPNTGVVIVYQGARRVFGGTSMAAPLWAGFAALINQQRASAGLQALGTLGPVLWAKGRSGAAVWNDVTVGSNGWPAASGYDNATGWGSPDGTNLMVALSNGFARRAFSLSPRLAPPR